MSEGETYSAENAIDMKNHMDADRPRGLQSSGVNMRIAALQFVTMMGNAILPIVLAIVVESAAPHVPDIDQLLFASMLSSCWAANKLIIWLISALFQYCKHLPQKNDIDIKLLIRVVAILVAFAALAPIAAAVLAAIAEMMLFLMVGVVAMATIATPFLLMLLLVYHIGGEIGLALRSSLGKGADSVSNSDSQKSHAARKKAHTSESAHWDHATRIQLSTAIALLVHWAMARSIALPNAVNIANLFQFGPVFLGVAFCIGCGMLVYLVIVDTVIDVAFLPWNITLGKRLWTIMAVCQATERAFSSLGVLPYILLSGGTALLCDGLISSAQHLDVWSCKTLGAAWDRRVRCGVTGEGVTRCLGWLFLASWFSCHASCLVVALSSIGLVLDGHRAAIGIVIRHTDATVGHALWSARVSVREFLTLCLSTPSWENWWRQRFTAARRAIRKTGLHLKSSSSARPLTAQALLRLCDGEAEARLLAAAVITAILLRFHMRSLWCRVLSAALACALHSTSWWFTAGWACLAFVSPSFPNPDGNEVVCQNMKANAIAKGERNAAEFSQRTGLRARCTYLGQPLDVAAGAYEADPIAWRVAVDMKRNQTIIAYRWALYTEDGQEQVCVGEKSTSYQNVLERGPPLPDGWENAAKEQARCRNAASNAEGILNDRYEVQDVTCQFLGVPSCVVPPSKDIAEILLRPGLVVRMLPDDSRVPSRLVLLCARVDDTTWFCHSGTPTDEGDANPFPINDLQEIDLNAFDQVLSVVDRRLRSETHTPLVDAVRAHRERVAEVVAYATYKAEERRAQTTTQGTFDPTAATASFEPLPWRWPSAMCRRKNMQAWFLYTWHEAIPGAEIGTVKRELVCQPLVEALQRRLVRAPFPTDAQAKNMQDEVLRNSLEQAAEHATRTWKAPCLYLGVAAGPTDQPGNEHFEPDPGKWTTAHLGPGGWKTHATVWFEWQHVQKGPDWKPHRVHVRADNTLYNIVQPTPGHAVVDTEQDGAGHDAREGHSQGEAQREALRYPNGDEAPMPRSIPHHPLRSPPTNLLFSFEFMQAVAEVTQPGCEFVGVAYDNKNVDVQRALPNDGVDLQEEPVYWLMPSGRTQCWSVKHLAEATGDQLAEGDPDKEYETVAEKWGYHCLGMPVNDGDLADLLDDPGTLKDQRWAGVVWTLPKSELARCWWILNVDDAVEKPEERPLIKCRSLLCMKLDLSRFRVATTRALIQEREARVAANRGEIARIQLHRAIWDAAAGPDPAILGEPTEEVLHEAFAAAGRIHQKYLMQPQDKREPPDEQECLSAFAAQVIESTSLLQLTSWDAIRRERFNCTPEALHHAYTTFNVFLETDSLFDNGLLFILRAMAHILSFTIHQQV